MTQDQYVYRRGSHQKGGVPAQVVGENLKQIEAKNQGRLTAPAVVKESEPEEAPLHDCFTWDNEKAGQLYREDEARRIIRSVRRIVPDDEPEPTFIHCRPVNPETDVQSAKGYYVDAREVPKKYSLYEAAWRTANARVQESCKALEDLEKLASKYVDDQSMARADAAKRAASLVGGAAELLNDAS